MVRSLQDLCSTGALTISPPIPTQPPPFQADQIENASDVRSQITKNWETLYFLEKQARWLKELMEKAELRIKEYEGKMRLLRRHASTLGLRSMDDLPPEILGLIFELCCTEVLPLDHTKSDFTFDRSPWLLSWVCSSWRQIAHKTHQLWSTIPGPMRLSARYMDSDDLNVLKAIRSRWHPASRLRATLICYGSRRSGDPLWSEVIFPHLDQIQELTFRCANGMGGRDFYRLLDFAPSDLPGAGLVSLRSLSFQVGFSCWNPNPPSTQEDSQPIGLPPLFHKMPNLQHMIIHSPESMGEGVDFVHLGFPWDKLTSLNMRDVSMHLVYDILINTRQLLQLGVSDIRGHPDDATRLGKRLMHPTLQLLHLHCRLGGHTQPGIPIHPPLSTHGVETFLNTVNLPKLTDLSLDHFKTFPSSVLSQFLERSQCSLLKLEISRITIDGLKKMLQMCPHVTKLSWKEPITREELELLIQPHDKRWLVPRMVTLVFQCSRSVCDTVALGNILQSRSSRDGVQELRKVEVITVGSESTLTKLPPLFKNNDNQLWSMDDSLDYSFETCSEYAAEILTTQCGYEVVNIPPYMDRIGQLCDILDGVGRDLDAHEQKRIHSKGLLAKLFQIYARLDQVDDIGNLYSVASEYKTRLRQALRRYTRDPWLFEAPPPGWTRTTTVTNSEDEEQCANHGMLVYTLP